MPTPVIERALELLPGVDFVNAYGLTETSSSIAVLTPDDHRAALESDDPAVRRRLGSVGTPLPAVEITVRDADGRPVPPGRTARSGYAASRRRASTSTAAAGRTVAGSRRTTAGGSTTAGTSTSRGRMDDVIVRGGENLSPGEIEDVLLQHPAVREAAVVGVPDNEWGEVVAAVVVLHEGHVVGADELSDHVVSQLRSSRRPAIVQIRQELPMNDTGKVLRRVLRDEFSGGVSHTS
jgi:acyl-CoA synthetase (AMP-forming)/AMP-acid ligase II